LIPDDVPRSWDQGLIPVVVARFDIAAAATQASGALDRGGLSMHNAEDLRPMSAEIANDRLTAG
jgi:hypothetical protein